MLLVDGSHSIAERGRYDPRLVNTSLIAQGYGNADIAGMLYLSLKTVRNHVSNIFTKLQVADRAQAVIRAREAGLGRE